MTESGWSYPRVAVVAEESLDLGSQLEAVHQFEVLLAFDPETEPLV